MAEKGMTEFRGNGTDYTINDPNIADEFSTSKAYVKGDQVNYQGNLYEFLTDRAAGSWNAAHVRKVKECERIIIRKPDGGNLFDYDSRLKNTDLISDGTMEYNANYFVSREIYIDGSKTLFIKKQGWVTEQWAYCWNASGTYLGRYNCNSGTVLNTASQGTVAYIRVTGREGIDTDLTVLQRDVWVDGDYPYSPIKGYGEGFAPKRVRFVNYNTGDFSGTGIERHSRASVLAYREVIQAMNPDVATFEYDVGRADQDRAFDEILKVWFKYGVGGSGTDYNLHAICGMFDMLSYDRVHYSITTSVSYTHTEFIAARMLINFVPVLVIAMHVDWCDKDVRTQQLAQIKSYCANDENVIITGDFNPEDYVAGVKQSNNLTYAADLAPFIADGYTPLNANDNYLGVIDTIVNGQENGPWDNILIKGSKIKAASFGRFERSWMNDHYPIYADLVIG